jgi:cation diffusion facilitator CzcD-associated flavoprotein CzcO
VSQILDVVIVGSGFSGLCMAIKLREEGRRSFVVLEKDGGLGGTWRANHYPGCACDIPSHLYSFSFAPNPHWSRAFAPQEEILAYLEGCADRFGVRPHLRFGCEVVRVVRDEAAALWQVTLRSGETLAARHVVLGIGALSRPAVPSLPGLERFSGATFHSAAWDHGYDLRGKRVAVIGTGASAIQFVPQIVDQVARLHLFQRTPPWVLPKPDRLIPPALRARFAAHPALLRLYRAGLYALLEARGVAFFLEPRLMRLLARVGRAHIARQIRDPALRRRVTPSYLPGCKRILLADDYYPALERPHVELVTDGIRAVTPAGIVAGDGVERPVDAILFGTGFQVTDYLTPIDVRGPGGVSLAETWRARGVEAHLGTMAAGFPNLYFLMGPNTGLGHNSMVFMIEAQVHHVMACLRALDRRGAAALDVRTEVQTAYNARLASRFDRTVWASGCQSWYLDARGRNPVLWPGFTLEFWLRTRRLDPGAFSFAH